MDETGPVKLLTNRLELIAATIEYVRAELEAPERLASLLEAQVEQGWPPGEYDRDAQEFFLARLTDGGMSVVGWYGWYALRRGDACKPSVLVGAGGYFGPPNEEGIVEIGFSVMPSWQGLGYATEIAGVLVENAFSNTRIQEVIAHATPGNLASRKVLEKCGFRYVSENMNWSCADIDRLRRHVPYRAGQTVAEQLRRVVQQPGA